MHITRWYSGWWYPKIQILNDTFSNQWLWWLQRSVKLTSEIVFFLHLQAHHHSWWWKGYRPDLIILSWFVSLLHSHNCCSCIAFCAHFFIQASAHEEVWLFCLKLKSTCYHPCFYTGILDMFLNLHYCKKASDFCSSSSLLCVIDHFLREYLSIDGNYEWLIRRGVMVKLNMIQNIG